MVFSKHHSSASVLKGMLAEQVPTLGGGGRRLGQNVLGVSALLIALSDIVESQCISDLNNFSLSWEIDVSGTNVG